MTDGAGEVRVAEEDAGGGREAGDGEGIGREADDGAGIGREAGDGAGHVEDRSRLLSKLSSHDLALAMDLVDSPDADREVVAYRVPDGVVNLERVTDRYRG